MSLTFNTKTYTGNSYAQDSVEYMGPAKTNSVRDDLVLRKERAKASATFSGVSRTTAKLWRTFTLTGALTPTGEGYVEIPVVIPVGAASADIDAILNDMGALLSSASFKTFVKSQQIAF